MAVVRARSTRRAQSVPVDPDDDFEEEEEFEDDEEVEEEVEQPVQRRRDRARPAAKKAAPAKQTARRPVPIEDDEDEYEDEDEVDATDVDLDEDEEEVPQRRRPANRPTVAAKKGTPPPGVRVGLSGAEVTRKSASGGIDRLTLSSEPELFKVLGNDPDEPFASFRQHWVSTGREGNRPYVCIGQGCPLCELGDSGSATYLFNILHLSGGTAPTNKCLEIRGRTYTAFKEIAASRTTGKVQFDKDFWALSKTGAKANTQYNFQPVKPRDIKDDWSDVLEYFDLADMNAIIAKAKKKLYDYKVIRTHTKKELRDIARYLADDEDES